MAECMILRRINEDAGTGLNIVNLGTATSFNLLDFVPFVDLTKVTADNFLVRTMNNITNANLGHAYWFADGGDPTGATRLNRSFNNTTGVFTCSGYGYCRGSDSNGTSPYTLNSTTAVNAFYIPKLSKAISLGSGQSFDVKTVCAEKGIDYTTLTVNNFYIKTVTADSTTIGGKRMWANDGDAHGWLELLKSYNATTGVATIKWHCACYGYDSNGQCPMYYNVTKNCDVYLIA